MEIIFWGATGQAKVLRELLGTDGPRLIAVFDNSTTVPPPFTDIPLVRGRDGFRAWRALHKEQVQCLVAIGGDRGRDRVELQQFLVEAGLEPHLAVHRTAFVASNAQLGPGSQILAHASVCVDARVGRACIVNTSATVDHDCVLGDGVHLGPGAHVAGCVEIGDYAMIGTGANILPRVRIGAGAVIGAGSVVLRDVPANATVVGNPGRIIRATVR
jgi:sugar O-acyltransferase (sialic acid O-acetyltransferase NeuD family)